MSTAAQGVGPDLYILFIKGQPVDVAKTPFAAPAYGNADDVVIAEYAPKQAPMDDAEIDRHLDAVLRASGSALRYYTMQKTLGDMRQAMRAALTPAAKREGIE